MAQGLGIPSVSPQLRGLLKPFIEEFTGTGKSPGNTTQTPTSSEQDSSAAGAVDLLDLSGGNLNRPLQISPNGFQLSPDGTYQFSRSRLSASLDFSLSQATVRAGQTGDGTSVFASLTNLNISISVSMEYEQALIQTGRTQEGDPISNFRNAARQVVDRFRAQQIQASMNFSLSFSQASISFSDGLDLQGDLDALAMDGSLAGLATLLQTFFGDDERFSDFIENMKSFMNGMSGSTPVADDGVNALAQSAGQGSQLVAVQSQSLDISVSLSFESTSIEVSAGQANASDPIVLDLDGDGVELTRVSEGVHFDLDADGVVETAATVTGGDGLLALDKNNNGIIDDGKELFGDQNGASDGFKELAKYDSNSDGKIDSQDSVFDQLRVLVRNGSEASSSLGQLLTLSQVGIQSISLQALDVSESASGGNRIAQRSYFTRADGTTGAAVDALLNRLV